MSQSGSTCVVPGNSRGGRILLHEGFRYSRKNKSKTQLRWICTVSGCGAYLYTDFFDVNDDNDPPIAVTRVDSHSHLPDNSSARRGLLLKEMHKRLADDPTQPVRRVYDEAIRDDSGDSDDLPAFSNVRTRTKLYRSQFVPPIPATITDVDIKDEWAKTWKGRQYLSRLDNTVGFALFSTNRMLRTLLHAASIYVDGTFRTAPHPYVQILTIHGLINGFVIPLVFVLMTGKSTSQYTEVLKHLKAETLRLTQQAFQPQRVILDFEHSLMIALEAEFPSARLSGCYFHFNQSLWRHVQHLGLATDYLQNRRLQKIVRKVMAIGFLPTLLVRQNFNLLRSSRRIQRLINTFPRLDDWFEYVDATYVQTNALFRPSIWNVYDRKSHTRTNNHVEGFHNRWNQKVGISHPNVWILIRKLKDEEKMIRHLLHAANRGDAPPKPKRRYRLLQQRIRRLKREYGSGQRNVSQYWAAVAYVVHNFN